MALEPVGVQFIAAGGDVYISTLTKSTAATNTFVDATEKGGGRVSGAGQVMIGALRQVGVVATQAFLAAGKAAVSFVGDSIKVAGDFESGMHKFQAVAGDAVDTKGLAKFKDLFISLGKELPVSTSEVEQAAIEMVSGGIDPAIVQAGALRSTIQFAAASGLSLADAAATSAKFLAGWTSASATTKEKVDFLTTSTDALTKAAAASSTTAAELRLGIFNVQGAAQALHAPFADVVATLAELAPAFESSAQAGTALNVFMTRLEPQTSPAAAAMKELGIITKNNQNLFFDAQGGFLGMGNAAQVLKEHLSGLSDEQKISKLHTLFGNDAMKVGNLLMQDGAAGIDAMKAKMDAANGVSATAALMQSGYNTALENAKGSVEALQIRIGGFLIPVLTTLLNDWIAPGINMITDWVTAITTADDPLLTFTQSVDDLAPGLGSIIGYIATLVSEGDTMNDFLRSTPDLFQGLVGGIQDAIPLFQNLIAVDEQITAALGSGDLSGAINLFVGAIEAAAPTIESALAGWGQAFIDWVAPFIPPLLTELGKLVAQAGAWIVAQLPSWGKQLLVWGQAFVAWIAPMIPPAIAELGKLATAFFGWVVDQAAPLLAKFLTWKDSFIAWIGPATVQFLQEWPKMFDAFLTWIGNQAGPLLKKLGDWAISFIQWIAPMIPPFLMELGKVAIAIGVWILETAAVLSNKIINSWLPAIVGWIVTTAIPGLVKALDSFLRVIDGWIKDTERSVGNWMLAVGKAIVEGIKQGISDAWSSFSNWIGDKVHSVVDTVKNAIGAHSPAAEFLPVGISMVQGIQLGFSNQWPELEAMVASYGKDLADQARSIAEDAKAAIADGFSGMATIDRQIAANLDKIADIKDAFTRAVVSQDLATLQKKAQAMYSDPKVAAAYFKMVSDNEFETLKIREQIAQASTQVEKDRLTEQLRLISDAQRAEENAFQATHQAGGAASSVDTLTSQLLQLIAKLNAAPLDSAGIALSDALMTWVDRLRNAPHFASGGYASAYQPHWVGETGPELFIPSVSGTVMPAASSMQLMQQSSTVNNNQSTNYTMPIYTNNSPAALQQSLAVMRAGLL